jgi:hypothetical protein
MQLGQPRRLVEWDQGAGGGPHDKGRPVETADSLGCLDEKVTRSGGAQHSYGVPPDLGLLQQWSDPAQAAAWLDQSQGFNLALIHHISPADCQTGQAGRSSAYATAGDATPAITVVRGLGGFHR